MNRSDEQNKLEKGLNIAEKELLIDALRRAKGNKALAAKILGIHRSLMYKKLTKHGLDGEALSLELKTE